MKISLKGLTRKELETLRKNVDKALDKIAETEKRAALAAAEKAAKTYGFSLADLADVKKPATAKPKAKAKDGRAKVAPKYRNPDDASMTWTGRGRQPKWVVAHLAAGKSLDDVLI